MFKRTTALALLALTALTACQNPNVSNRFSPRLAPVSASARFQARNANVNWHAQLPADLQNYYASAKGLTGRELFMALHNIVSRAKQLDYGPGKSFLYAVADNHKQGNQSGVTAVYSDLFVPGSGGSGGRYREQGDQNKDRKSGDFINCEHTWPQSFFSKREPMRSDLHHLYPTLSVPNNRRGHHPFGMGSEGKVVYSTSSGSKLALRGRALSFSSAEISQLNALGAQSEQSEEDNFSALGKGEAVFEPSNNQKGNTARATLYFYLRFYNRNIRQGDYDASDYLLRRLPMFAEWSAKVDPVDEAERRRNSVIAERQGNRNPFVDIPDLVNLIGFDTFREIENQF